jgi:hypothetical protein
MGISVLENINSGLLQSISSVMKISRVWTSTDRRRHYFLEISTAACPHSGMDNDIHAVAWTLCKAKTSHKIYDQK